MNKKIIEKINEEQEKEISGGYVSDDWTPKYSYAYDRLEIKHIKNSLAPDEYFLKNKKLPWKFAIAAANGFLHSDKLYLGPNADATPESVMKTYNDLVNELNQGKNDMLRNIRNEYK